jgi:hypothetical protein
MVENGINKLDQLVKTIKYIKEKKIYEIIDYIDNMILFDHNLMFSKRWVKINLKNFEKKI